MSVPQICFAAPVQRVIFGSTQERRLLPLYYAPDRLGNKMSREEAPHLGPGCYDNQEVRLFNICSRLQKPESKKGYGLSARTAARFPPCGKVHETKGATCTIHSNTDSMFSHSQMFILCYSPGTYALDAVTNRKVSWPMCFGNPDWSKLPQLQKKSLRVKMRRLTPLSYLSVKYEAA
uniref:Uncharacterized protein n=1 Tax=Dicentrarchus labrax TaxID=13489 RepID=A0A8C4F3Q8_DICLA